MQRNILEPNATERYCNRSSIWINKQSIILISVAYQIVRNKNCIERIEIVASQPNQSGTVYFETCTRCEIDFVVKRATYDFAWRKNTTEWISLSLRSQ